MPIEKNTTQHNNMPKLPIKFSTAALFVVLTFLITLGLAISLQSVFGLNIAGPLAGPLDLGNKNITSLAEPRPFQPQDAATKGYVDSVAGGGGGWTDDGTIVRLTTSSDNVGIGTANPTSKLDVSGGDVRTGEEFLSSVPEGSCPLWKDCDGDTKTGGAADCNENCSTCFVGSTSYPTVLDGKDQDCDELIDEVEFYPAKSKTCGSPGGGNYSYSISVANCKAWCFPRSFSMSDGGWATSDAWNYLDNWDTCLAPSCPSPSGGCGRGYGQPFTCSCTAGTFYR